MKHLRLFEDYNTGRFRVNINGNILVLTLYVQHSNITNVYLMLGDDIYDNLSVELPDSEKLDKDEFFINPDVDEEIIKELINQGFIEEGTHKSIAGDKKTKSYILV
jgi:hypothetical protein